MARWMIFLISTSVSSALRSISLLFQGQYGVLRSARPFGVGRAYQDSGVCQEFVRVPIIVDAKRADVAHSSKAHAKYVFEIVGGDAVTVSPYMGLDAIEPFIERRNKGVFILCKTSNAGAAEIQNLSCAEPLYQVVAKKALEWNIHGNLGIVAGATQGGELKTVRGIVGEDVRSSSQGRITGSIFKRQSRLG